MKAEITLEFVGPEVCLTYHFKHFIKFDGEEVTQLEPQQFCVLSMDTPLPAFTLLREPLQKYTSERISDCCHLQVTV